MRRGFGMVYGVIVLMVIGTIGVYTLDLSSRSLKSVSDEKIKMQLALYMNSSVEYALLWLSGERSRSQNPSDLNISFENGNYRFQIHMTPLSTNVSESNGTVILDALGRFAKTGAEPIVATKRLVLKP